MTSLPGDFILAHVAQMSLDPSTFIEVEAALSSNERPVSLDKARLERQIRALAASRGFAFAMAVRLSAIRRSWNSWR